MKFLFVEVAWYLYSGVTLLFEHSPSRVSEIEHFEIFSRPRENQLARRFFVNLIFLKTKQTFTTCTK